MKGSFPDQPKFQGDNGTKERKSGCTGSTMFRKIVLLIAIFVCLGLGLYFTYFHRPPTADILAANQALHGRQLQAEDDDDDEGCSDAAGCDTKVDETDPVKLSSRAWNHFIKENKFVSIGKLYNTCNETDRITLGRVIMLPDEENGGVTSRTYINVTLDRVVTGGQMYLTCQYNGNDLYSNHWELCTVEEGTGDQVIHCPIRTGRRKFVKTLKIPNYLPKGHYSTKAWLTNQNDELLGCAFADFRI